MLKERKRMPAIKGLAVIALLSFQVIPTAAQVDIGTKHKNLTKEHISTLKATTTVFVVQDRDSALIPYFSERIGRVWTMSPIKVISTGQLGPYLDDERFSLFTFNYEWDLNSGYALTGLCYDLLIPDGARKKKGLKRLAIASYHLSAHWKDHNEASDIFRRIRERDHDYDPATMKFLHERARFLNWHPAYMAGFFRYINDKLGTRDNVGTKDEFVDQAAMEKLKNDTLFIPLSASRRLLSGIPVIGDPGPETKSPEAILSMAKDYPYLLKVIDDSELAGRIMHAKKPLHYLMFSFYAPDKNIAVLEGQEGRMIYLNRVRLSNHLNADDFRRLARNMK